MKKEKEWSICLGFMILKIQRMFDSHFSPSYYKFEISFLEHPKYIKNLQVRKGIFPTQPRQVLRVILRDPRAEQILITSTK